VYQSKATYAVSGTTLTFSTAPPVAGIEVMVAKTIVYSIGQPDDNTVSTVKIQDDAVTTDKLANNVVINTSGAITGAAGSFTTGQFGTSLNVDGTATVDGLTVDGDASISSSNVRLRLFETDTTDLNTQFQNSGGDFFLKTLADDASSSTTRLSIDHSTGDISFYNSGGSAAKLFWDASAESLGIGTSSPSTKLHLGGTAPGDSIIRQDSTASGTNWEIGEREAGKWQIFEDDSDSVVATFMSSGNVGIGASSPATPLHVYSASQDGGKVLIQSGTLVDNNRAALFMSSQNVNGHTGNVSIECIHPNNQQSDLVIRTGATDATSFGTERMRVTTAGDVKVSTGNLVIGTAGKGIDFSANGNAGGMTSELLDDYEEGTWTPTIVAYSGTNPTVNAATYTSGFYTKIGNLVTVSFKLDMVTVTGVTGGLMKISGLPFAPNGEAGGTYTGNQLTLQRPDTSAVLVLADGFGILSSSNGGNWGWELSSIFDGSSNLRSTVSYKTNS